MTDLDAIRARHQPVAGLREDEGHLFEPATFCRHCVTLWPCDAHALLAEVHRLREQVATAVLTGEVWPTGGNVKTADAWVAAYVSAERARIRKAVEGMTPVMVRKDMLVPDPKWDDMVTRAAVLAAIDGEPKRESVREQMVRLGIPLPSEEEQQRRVDEITRKPIAGDMDDD